MTSINGVQYQCIPAFCDLGMCLLTFQTVYHNNIIIATGGIEIQPPRTIILHLSQVHCMMMITLLIVRMFVGGSKGTHCIYLALTECINSPNLFTVTVLIHRRLDTYAAHVMVCWTRSDSASVTACFTFLPQQPRSHVNMAWDQG